MVGETETWLGIKFLVQLITKKEGHQKQKGTGDETLHQAPLVLGNQTGKSPHNIWL